MDVRGEESECLMKRIFDSCRLQALEKKCIKNSGPALEEPYLANHKQPCPEALEVFQRGGHVFTMPHIFVTQLALQVQSQRAGP